MSGVGVDIEPIVEVEELIKPHELTLQHALEISPLVKERTIGPDLPEYKHEESTNSAPNSPKNIPAQKLKTPKSQESSPKLIIPVLKPSPSLDYELVSATLMLRDAEEKRKKLVRQQMQDMQEKQLTVLRENAARLREQQSKQMHALIAEKQRNDAHILEEAERQSALELQEIERQMGAMRLQAKRQLQLFSFQCVAKYHSVFRSKYEAVAKALISIDKQALLSCSDYNRQLKELVELFEQLTTKIKTDECGATELKLADSLCNKMDALYATIHEDLDKLVKQQEQARQEEQRKAEEEELAAALALSRSAFDATQVEVSTPATATVQAQAPPQNETAEQSGQAQQESANQTQQSMQLQQQQTQQQLPQSSAPTNEEPTAALKFYQEIYSFYQAKVDSVKPLQSDENMKKYRFACQKAINIPLNAISAVNPQHLQDKFERIFNFLNGQPLKTADGQVSVNDHPLGRNYCLLLTAKRFVNQGETAISSNPQAAFPVASVVVSLWKLIPDFGKLFLAYIFKESPFLVPLRGKSVEEYNDLKRQAGITRLYAAVMITNGRRAEGPDHPYGLQHAWRWLVDFSSLEPLPDISATLILEMLQTLGFSMCRTYGKQFTKLLLYISRDYFARLAQVDEGGPRTRLEMLLMDYLNQKQISAPQGTLPPSFW
ncbi:PREDICTED: nucleoporin GLE1 isoform X2 [Rhagoletis zephyria]|uniref:nucleoporin Gle1 n=1 Tax=Rhagoletis pomonella TaxID=28610 RepID=UPI0008119657|nr:PREDICTED: nucleoporin GLE1 isoform X1 [Rhagoletis zephyria]XP_017487411.1 PREDICTED: nucleoporin GLE1 isoform X2 [Rhagoletis zephyria]XP_036334440.1 nucleoporin Gle1 [Rhagoletis pomonella]